MTDINKKELSESDICEKYITPAIVAAGWEPFNQIRREVTLTPGPVIVRGNMFEECNLHTIVRLPNGVFSPYTGIKTNLLFFTKGTPTETVWYYEHPYSEGVKNYNKGKPMRFEEFQP